MSRRQAATGLTAGLVMILTAPLAWWLLQPEPAGQSVTSVNAAAAQALASSPVTSGAPGPASSDAAASASQIPSSSASPSPISTEPAATAPATSGQPSTEPAPAQPAPVPLAPTGAAPAATAPARIELPTLGVEAEVVPVGVDEAGLMEIPQDVDTVGWYRFGPAPGSAAGSSVLSGHVDDYRQGSGVFARIGDLEPGATVRVTDTSGAVREFQVIAREEWSKGEVPLDRLFDRGGESRLVLITCGGSFNSSTLGYDDNIAITATPIGP
jgi:sortase (surface protein transpeptidase)